MTKSRLARNKKQLELNKIYCMDCLEGIKRIPDNSVDLVLTDPPFMISREARITRSRNPMKFYKYQGKNIELSFGEWDCFDSEKDYWRFTFNWLEECWRVMRKGAHILIFFDKFKITPLVEWVKGHKGIARQPLFFIKTNPVPMARKVSFMNSVSLIFWATKDSTSRKYATFHYELGQHKDYVEVPITPTLRNRERHPCEKHIKIMEWLISYLSNSNDVVMDCFCGTGVVAEACLKLDRKFICIDKDSKWVEIAKNRIKPYLERPRLK